MSAFIYERRGGIAGISQRLEVDDAAKATVQSRSGKKPVSLTAQQQQSLSDLIRRAQGTAVPSDARGATGLADGFEVRVFLGQVDKPQATLHGEPPPGAWGELMKFCDALLTAQLGLSVDLVDESLLK